MNPTSPATELKIQPYLFFEGRCEEAIEFYKSTLGAEVLMLIRFKDSPPSDDSSNMCEPVNENKVMHATLRIGAMILLMSDGRCRGTPNFQGFSLSLNATTDAEAAKLSAALAVGGQVSVPLSKTFFATSFAIVEDRFGVEWMVIKEP